ncbi:MAG: DUF861 domain-containing protein [Rhodobacteraceae bacterium]|nr:DUF861 domain-containing protein [Paracoccaceae bacterium]
MTATTGVIQLEPDGPAGTGLAEMELNPAGFQSPLPVQHLHVYFSGPALGLTVGVWDTTDMQEAFGPYPGDEFIVLLKGGCEIEDGKGGATPIAEGESAMIRNGIPVSWKQDGYLKKFFFTYLDPGAATPQIASADGGVVVHARDVPLTPLDTTDPFVIEGPKPDMAEHVFFENAAGNVFSGLWESGPMESAMRPHPAYEFLQVLEGEVTLTEESGATHSFGPGACFFVPKGTVASWKIDTRMKCYFAKLEI